MNKKLLIAGSRSGVGKTTISLGLMAAFKKRGLKVQPFKVGPDYIDPAFHSLVCGRSSYNLDSYFLKKSELKNIFHKAAADSDLAVIEGVMGLFDGKGKNSKSSSAEIAKFVNSPVILIIDARKIAQSAAAVVYGYKNYDPALKLKGLIINNVSSEHHFKLLKEAVNAKMPELKVLGYLPKDQSLKLPESYLGLIPAQKTEELKDYLAKLVGIIEKYLDLDSLLKIADFGAEENLSLQTETSFMKKYFSPDFKEKIRAENLKIALASDQAFNFYYQANLDLLTSAGAEIIEVSPLNDSQLAEVDAFYIGGGFPEKFLKRLSENKSFQKSLTKQLQKGLPLYAEAGGLIYLAAAASDLAGNKFKLLDLIPVEIEMTSKLQAMGYREIKALSDNLLLAENEQVRGHLFHYSKITDIKTDLEKKFSSKNKEGGYSTADNILASYFQLHFLSNPNTVKNFLKKALLYKKNRGA